MLLPRSCCIDNKCIPKRHTSPPTACVTVAEVRKRGDDFWKEFEFFLSDWAVGLVLDVALVTLITPAAVLGRRSVPKGAKTPNGMGLVMRLCTQLMRHSHTLCCVL